MIQRSRQLYIDYISYLMGQFAKGISYLVGQFAKNICLNFVGGFKIKMSCVKLGPKLLCNIKRLITGPVFLGHEKEFIA